MDEPTPDPFSPWKLTQALDPNAPPVYIGRGSGVTRKPAPMLDSRPAVLFDRLLTQEELLEVLWLFEIGLHKTAAWLYGGQVIEPTATP